VKSVGAKRPLFFIEENGLASVVGIRQSISPKAGVC
jgi:hypothetical protein